MIDKIIDRTESISLVGLGYVGMPIAVAFAKKANVIGFDLNKAKIETYLNGIDPTKEVGDDVIKNTTVQFTSDETKLRDAKFHIVAVPTPLTESKTPDLSPLIGASEIVGRNLTKGSYVVFESTVYPGVTEEICVPILEDLSGLKCGVDFKVGYSPERINPGDKVHTLENIVKVVSGCDEESLDTIAKVYELVVDAGVHRAQSIKVAEAAKVIENSQRDINIAFMNELSKIFNKLDINTNDVLEAAGTKWNFLKFTPGLVGGHCIGIDPYYLTHKAAQVGYHSEIILSGRKINDQMGEYVADNIIKTMVKNHIDMKHPRVAIMGLTFKENTPDVRNTRIIDIVEALNEYGVEVVVCDAEADASEVKHEYGIDLVKFEEIKNVDVVVAAVAHNEYLDVSKETLDKMFRSELKILFDIKSIYSKYANDFVYWSL
ncbi:nucleotide sugar dehydrogenase [Erysipelothrix sp. HDW6C]|uniref:nucleotide sugar dehydrogenase n=1 Tax=Erysipelothrix sp. HDW6C TaxID=2714930 RepID=UPI00140C562F|nr:nucleotide sugar dehydrogenase [Erysipelothrix sp. HDW6C]QIK70028.1 nucleotide sugar dehydrogenase [Erysipelothrix sp. HDW6C]